MLYKSSKQWQWSKEKEVKSLGMEWYITIFYIFVLRILYSTYKVKHGWRCTYVKYVTISGNFYCFFILSIFYSSTVAYKYLNSSNNNNSTKEGNFLSTSYNNQWLWLKTLHRDNFRHIFIIGDKFLMLTSPFIWNHKFFSSFLFHSLSFLTALQFYRMDVKGTNI